MATTNSVHMRTIYSQRVIPAGRPVAGMLAVLWLAGGVCVAADPPASEAETLQQFRQAAEKTYQTVRAQYRAATTNVSAAWTFARACFDLAEFSRDDTERESLALEGMSASRQSIIMKSDLAEGHYYLGMNQGQLARTKMLGALKLVHEMADTFKLASSLDAHVDYAGPDRCLGLLYRDAPGWPTSVGSKSKARTYLLKAAQLEKDFPENQLNLVESYLQWSERKNALAISNTVQAVMVKARATLTGAVWACSWHDWDKRWEAAREKLGKK